MGVVSEVLVKAIQKNGTANAHNNKDGSAGGGVDEKVEGKVLVNAHVERIDTEDEGRRAVGVTLRRGNRKIKAKVGVICNVPIWSLRKLLDEDGVKVLDAAAPPDTWRRKQQAKKDTAAAAPPTKTEEQDSGYLSALEETEMTRSFLHLHLALDAKGLDLDTMEAHYTVMAKGLYAGNDATTQPNVCGELNMVAVSNPCVLDRTLAPPGYIILHAYAAGNEPYEPWSKPEQPPTTADRDTYQSLKEQRCAVLWRAVESIVPDARSRAVLAETASPATHARFLRRPSGTYGAATEDLLPDGRTAVEGLVLC